jgi:WhiB family transcriptional regulator, redox-sensing transcriptional regulator
MVRGTQMTIRSVLCDAPNFAQAVCATLEDQDYFFPDGRIDETERLSELKALCASCIHRKECLEYAISNEIPYGIWGGSTPREREEVIRPLRITNNQLANQIIDYNKKGFIANEIATQLDLSIGYVRKIITRYVTATRKGEIQSHPKTKDDSSQSLESSS